MRRSPQSEWRDHLKPRRPEEVRRDALLRREPVPEPHTAHMEYVGSQRPELRGRTALVMRKRIGVVMAQFDFPEWQQFNEKGHPIEPVDPLCFHWHEFTEGEFQPVRETGEQRRERARKAQRQSDKAYRKALADFGQAPAGDRPMQLADGSIDEEWEYGMDHLVGLDGWGRD